MVNKRTVKISVLELLETKERRYTEVVDSLKRPDKTICFALKNILRDELAVKMEDRKYAITKKGRLMVILERVKENIEVTFKDAMERANDFDIQGELLLAVEDQFKKLARELDSVYLLRAGSSAPTYSSGGA